MADKTNSSLQGSKHDTRSMWDCSSIHNAYVFPVMISMNVFALEGEHN